MTQFTADSASFLEHPPLKKEKGHCLVSGIVGSLTCYAPEMKVGHLPFS